MRNGGVDVAYNSSALRSPPSQELPISKSGTRSPRASLLALAALTLSTCAWTACGPPMPAGASPAPDAPAVRPVGLVLGLTFEDDVVDEAVLARFEALIDAASSALWQASEGQLFIGRCSVAERASWGQVCVPRGALELETLESGAAFELSSPGAERWRLLSPGRPADDERTVRLFAANLARGVFGLDEHTAPTDAAVPGQGCLLAGTATRLCAEHDQPRLARRACRSVIDERWLGLATFPNPGWSPDEPTPQTAFERLRETP